MEYVCFWCVFGVTLITAPYSLAYLLLLWSSVKANPRHGPDHPPSSVFLHLPSPSLGQGPWAQLSTAVIPWALISRSLFVNLPTDLPTGGGAACWL